MSQTQVLPIELPEEKLGEHNISNPIGFIVLEGAKFEIKIGHNNIGRDPQKCSIVINDRTVSKVHSVIECESIDDIFIYDNGSTNKTMLGKKYLKPHCRYKLEHDNLITMGNISVRFVLSFNIEHNQQWQSLKNLDIIFDAETQLSFSEMQGHFLNTSAKMKTIQPNKFDNLNLQDNIICRKQTTTSTTSNRSTVQPINLDALQNSDIFSLETQCHINPNSILPTMSTLKENIQVAAVTKETLQSTLPMQNDCIVMNSCDSGLPNSVPKNSTQGALVSSPKLEKPLNINDNPTEQMKGHSVLETSLVKGLQENYFVENDDDDDETVLQHFINEDDERANILNLSTAGKNAAQHSLLNKNTSERNTFQEDYSSDGINQENKSGQTSNHSSPEASSTPNSSKTKPSFFLDERNFRSVNTNAMLPNRTANSHAYVGRALDGYKSENEGHEFNRFYSSPTKPSLLLNSTDDSETQDFIETNLICSQRIKSEFDNNDFGPISSVANVCSVVPESSDDDRTLSDIEIIDDTPYFQRSKAMQDYSGERKSSNSGCQRRLLFSSRVQTTEVFNISEAEQKSEGSESSDSSYVFDLINDNENTNQPLSTEDKNMKTIQFDSTVSDSDCSDIIEMTPLPHRSYSFSGRSVNPPDENKNPGIEEKNSNSISKYELSTESHLNDFDSTRINHISQELKETFEILVLRGRELGKMNGMEMQKNNSNNSASVKHLPNEINDPKIGISKTPGKRDRISSKETEFELIKKLKKSDSNYAEGAAIEGIIGEERFAPKKIMQVVQFLNNTEARNTRNSHFENLKNASGSTSEITTSSDENKCSDSPNETSRKRKNVNTCQSDYEIKINPHCSKPSVRENKGSDNDKAMGYCEEGPWNRFSPGIKHIPENSPEKGNKKTKNAEENSTVRIAFTGFDSMIMNKIIEDLGGEKIEDLHRAHVLVTDQIRRTVKFLCAIGLAIPITSPQWLLLSQKKKRFLNPWNYLLKCKESEKKWNFDLKSALEKSTEQKLLQGFSVFATNSVKPPVDDILNIVKCCGGIPLRDKPKTWTKKTIVVSCLEDKKSWPPWKFRFVEVLHYEFILSGVLQQNLDFKTFRLR